MTPAIWSKKIAQELAHYRNPQTPAGFASVWVDRKTLGRQRDCINSNYIDVRIYMADWYLYIWYLLIIYTYIIWFDMHISYTVKLSFLLKDLRQIAKVNPSKIEVWWIRSTYLERVCTINTYNNSLSFNQSAPPFLSIVRCQNPHDARSTRPSKEGTTGHQKHSLKHQTSGMTGCISRFQFGSLIGCMSNVLCGLCTC